MAPAPLESGTPECVFSDPNSGWETGTFSAQNAPFAAFVDLSISAPDADALFGLSNGPAATYTDLAAIVRFNDQGFVDVRNGGTYAADQSLTYGQGGSFSFVLDVDPVSHSYTVRQSGTAGPPLANGYAFRTEQSAVSALDHFAVKVDGTGTLEACNVQIEPASACSTAVPSGGFKNTPFAAQSSLVQVSFRATPNADGIDGVVGLSARPAAAFNDLATAIRFNPSGFMDARRGDSYASDLQVPYSAGNIYTVQATIDVLQHTYSVYVNGHALAHDYAFRTQQATVASLSNAAWVVDSATGSLSVCEFTATRPPDVLYLHDAQDYGTPSSPATLAALPNGGALLGGTAVTRKLDANGLVVGTTSHGGRVRSDANGNAFLFGSFSGTYDGGTGAVASQGGTDLYVSKYDPSLSPLWTVRLGSAGDDFALSDSVDDAGDSAVLFAPLSGGPVTLVRSKPDGSVLSTSTVDASLASLAPDGSFALAQMAPGPDIVISRYDASGAAVWRRSLPAGGDVSLLAADANGVSFSGRVSGLIDFGGGHTLRGEETENGDPVYIARLDATGAYVFATLTDTFSDYSYLSSSHVNIDEPVLSVYDATGNSVYGRGIELVPPFFAGFAGAVAPDSAGHVFWYFSARGTENSVSFLAKLSR
jgi:hypothetical protein